MLQGNHTHYFQKGVFKLELNIIDRDIPFYDRVNVLTINHPNGKVHNISLGITYGRSIGNCHFTQLSCDYFDRLEDIKKRYIPIEEANVLIP